MYLPFLPRLSDPHHHRYFLFLLPVNRRSLRDSGWQKACSGGRTMWAPLFDWNRKPRDHISIQKIFRTGYGWWACLSLPPSNLRLILLPWAHRYITDPVNEPWGVIHPFYLAKNTYVSEQIPINPYKLAELSIAFVYLTGSSPQTCWDAHGRENTVIVK